MYPPSKNACSKSLDVIIAHKVGNKKDFSNICSSFFVGKYVDNLLITFTTSYLLLLSKQFDERKLMENGAGKFW